MRDLNSWIGTGRIGKEIELKTTPNGKYVANFSLAVAFDDKVEWVMCVAWDKAAEALSKYARKGDRLTIGGRLMTREYQHNGENRKVTEINVEKIIFPDRKEKATPEEYREDLSPDRKEKATSTESYALGSYDDADADEDEDLPF